MDFVKHIPVRRREGSKPLVSIRKRGRIAFNAAAVKEYGLTEYSHVVLYWSEGARAIGLQPIKELENAPPMTEGAVVLRKRSSGWDIAAHNFCREYGLLFDHGKSLESRYDVGLGMIVVPLNGVEDVEDGAG
jgi:hypothetical protein